MIPVPKEIVWDYAVPPEDERWRAQRLAEFFPNYGRDRDTVQFLLTRLADLKIPDENKELIRMYARHYALPDAA